FSANPSSSVGLHLHLLDVNLGVTFSVPIDTKSEQLFGSSDVSDLQLTAITKKWFADAYYQRYDGFYVQSQDNVIPSGQPFPQRADLSTINYGASFAYIFNNQKFSLRAPYLFSERQLSSKGSFLLSSVFSSFSVAADSSFIPAAQWVEWGRGAEARQVQFTSLGLAPGYSHTFVVRHFFLNLAFALGPAHYWVNYQGVNLPARYDIRIDFYSLGRIGIGYNGERFFSGISVASQSRNVTYERTTFQNTIATVRFVVGFRFKEVGFLKNKATDLLPDIL
ncbi:MAG: DUF4421 family protein, partial [Cyclobacteriaceae bacterium]